MRNLVNSLPKACLMTPPGRGAVATIRLMGDCSLLENSGRSRCHLSGNRTLATQRVGDILFAQWGGDYLEDVVLCRQSEQIVDIHCHGGHAAVNRILNDLKDLGIEIVSWEKLLRINSSIISMEIDMAIRQSTTLRTANLLLEQLELLERELNKLDRSPERESDWQMLAETIESLLKWSQLGLHLTNPWNVVLTGQPNVGKSSLLNALAGFERTIVYDQPGTTRDVIEVDLVFEGWPVRLLDTAGIRNNAGELEQAGIDRAEEALAQADCQLILIDISQPPTERDEELLNRYPQAIVIAHKCDLPSQWGASMPTEAIYVSSLTGEGVPLLIERFIQELIPDVPPAFTPLLVTERQQARLQQMFQAVQQQNSTLYQQSLELLLRKNIE